MFFDASGSAAATDASTKVTAAAAAADRENVDSRARWCAHDGEGAGAGEGVDSVAADFGDGSAGCLELSASSRCDGSVTCGEEH